MNTRSVILAALLVCAACRHRKPADNIAFTPPDDLVLEVSNNNWSDVLLYMVRDGSRARFAIVTAAHSSILPIPARYVSANGSVQIVARRIGGTDEYVSPAVSIVLGHTVALTLESNLSRSTIGVW